MVEEYSSKDPVRKRNDPQHDSSVPSMQKGTFDRARIRRAALPSSGCRNAIVHPAKNPTGAEPATLVSAGIHAVRVDGSIAYGLCFSMITAAVRSTSVCLNPNSLPADLIDSQRGVVKMPDSQTTEQIPQVVHRKRLSKRAGRSDPARGLERNRAMSPVERVPAFLQMSIRSMAPSGIPALTTGHAATHSWHRVQASSSSIWRWESQRDSISEKSGSSSKP